MFKKSTAHNHVNHDMSKLATAVVHNEKCASCNHDIPEGRLVLRHVESNHIICVICLAELAEVI